MTADRDQNDEMRTDMGNDDRPAPRNPGMPIDIRGAAFEEFMADYPSATTVEQRTDLPVQQFTTDVESVFRARVLGFGTSWRDSHLNHRPGTRPQGRCSGCRWTDTAILWDQEGGLYVLVSLGKSIVDGERQHETFVWAPDDDAMTIFKAMFVPTKAEFRRDRSAKAIPPHNGEALREAAAVDVHFADVVERFGDLIPGVNTGVAPF